MIDKDKVKENQKKVGITLGVCCGLPILIIIISMLFGGSDTQTSSPNSGDQGRLYMDGGTIPVAITKDALDKMTRSFNVKDEIGFDNLFLSGQAFWTESGTKVLVIDMSFATRKIRILEGSQYGRSGWVPYEWVKNV